MTDLYTSGEYLSTHQTWHVEDSEWKAQQILKMIIKNNLAPKTICEVGCGAGEILKQLQSIMEPSCFFCGYEISPQAFDLCQRRANERLRFKLGDITEETEIVFDLLLVIDVIEHIEDYFAFLRKVKERGVFKLFHIPLELCALSVAEERTLLNVSWQKSGHIHFFTKGMALRALKDTGYQIVDYVYTPAFMRYSATLREKVLKLMRRGVFPIQNDLSARLLGGCSLMVLVR